MRREFPEVVVVDSRLSNPEHQAVLFRFRMELYAAAQLMKGKDLDDFIQLIDEVKLVAESERHTPV